MSGSRHALRWALGPMLLAVVVACGSPTPTAGLDQPLIVDPVATSEFDRVDLQAALDLWYDAFTASPFVAEVPVREHTIAILRIDNDTSARVGSALRKLIEAGETRLVHDRVFRVVSNEQLTADAASQERLRNLGESVDPETMAAMGKTFGIDYFVHGRVGETVEKTRDSRRVQYFLFLKVTEVATTERVFQLQIPIVGPVDG